MKDMPENQTLSLRGHKLPESAHSPAGQVLDIEAQEFDSFGYLRIYWNIISKRRWTIISAAFIVTLLVAIASFKMTPIYEATVRLDIEADTPQIQSLNDLYRDNGTSTDEDFIGTQIQVLEGVSLAERTIEQVGLLKDPKWVAAIQQSSGPLSSEFSYLAGRACRAIPALSARPESARQSRGECQFRERGPPSLRQSRKLAGGQLHRIQLSAEVRCHSPGVRVDGTATR